LSGRKFTRFRREYWLYLKFKLLGSNLVKENGIIDFGPAEPQQTAHHLTSRSSIAHLVRPRPTLAAPGSWNREGRASSSPIQAAAAPSPVRPTPTGQEHGTKLASLHCLILYAPNRRLFFESQGIATIRIGFTIFSSAPLSESSPLWFFCWRGSDRTRCWL
jgi:hypothetical protein